MGGARVGDTVLATFPTWRLIATKRGASWAYETKLMSIANEAEPESTHGQAHEQDREGSSKHQQHQHARLDLQLHGD